MLSTVAIGARYAYTSIGGIGLVQSWSASQYWVTYRDGFIRRGLPGQVLAWLTNGTPTGTQMSAYATVLAGFGAVALGLLALLLGREASTRRGAFLVFTLIAVSPFTFSLIVRDLGRYDVIGFVGLVMVALIGLRASGLWAAILSGLVCIVAVASEEFLLVHLAPVVLLAVRYASRGSSSATYMATAAVLPAAGMAVASTLVRPDRGSLLRAVDLAHVARPDIARDGRHAIAALSQSLESAVSHYFQISPWTMPVLAVLFGGFAAAAVALAWVCVGCPQGRILRGIGLYLMLATVGLSVVGIDYRRWWGLAFVAALASLVLLCPCGRQGNRDSGLSSVLFTVAVLATSVALQLAPVAASGFDRRAATSIVLETASCRELRDLSNRRGRFTTCESNMIGGVLT